ncbi:MAG: crotonyl-CoA carboxylase/reductase [Flavobacteriaceae bacterium]|nr:crotonyl-CoA carboxylase/reductase [Flavobacteriaceae bacterium]
MWAYGIDKETVKKATSIPVSKRKPSDYLIKLDVPKPQISSNEVLVKVNSSALNYNSIWSTLCHPISPFQLINQYVARNKDESSHLQDFAIFGSDASGTIEEIGDNVKNWKVGDNVIIHCNIVNSEDPIIQRDGMLSESQSIWGYETNYGAFAEYTKVKSSQLIKKPEHLGWEESASFGLTLSTAYRMLISKNGAKIRSGETCLIWGAAGGLGLFAIQLAKLAGANVIAIVSSDEKVSICKKYGADFVINRKKDFPESFTDQDGNPDYLAWRKISLTLKKLNVPDIDVVFEHVGKETLGLSTYLLKRGGRVVICAATSGFLATIDLRFLWMQLKSIIGSHFANYDEANEAAKLVFENKITPVFSKNHINSLPKMMDEMYNGKTHGKIVFNHSEI